MRGMYSNRRLYVNGEVPCLEANQIKFYYDTDWSITTPKSENGDDLYFYLQAGTNTISLEAVPGEIGEIMGNLDERLEKERSELYAAALRYDSARQELHAVEADLAARREELSLLGNCEAEYDRLLEARARELRQDPQSPAARRLLALEERQAQLASREKELQEAIQAGYNALSDISSIESALSSAEGWGTWDVFGGGLISDMAKYSHLDDAQQQINGLQRSLSRFRTELADVDIRTGIQIEVDSFLRFADYFFDNIFTDWAVLDRIRHTQSQIHEVDGSVRTILSRLERDLEQCRRDRQVVQQELKDFLVTA